MNDYEKSKIYVESIATMLQAVAPGRFSSVLVNQIAYMPYAGINEPHQFIIPEIKHLEDQSSPTQTKDFKSFQRPEMKGLLAKHFFLPHYIGRNINNYWRRQKSDQHSFEGVFSKYIKIYEQDTSVEKAKTLSEVMAREFVDIPLKAFRSGNASKTGEYIIFKEHAGLRYYLCLGIHQSDNEILEWVEEAYKDFPFL